MQAAAASGIAAYLRALEALSQQRQEEAAEYLRQSVDQTPSNTFALRSLVELYFNSLRFGSITELYGKLGIAALSSAPETVAQVALSFWETGDSDAAHRILKAAESRFPKNALLVAAARKIAQPRSSPDVNR